MLKMREEEEVLYDNMGSSDFDECGKWNHFVIRANTEWFEFLRELTGLKFLSRKTA